MEFVRQIPLGVNVKAKLFQVGKHRLNFLPEFTMPTKIQNLQKWIVEHWTKISTSTNDWCYTNSGLEVFWAKKIGFPVVDNTVKHDKEGQISKKKFNYRFRQRRHVLTSTKCQIFNEWKKHIKAQGPEFENANKIGKENFLKSIPFYVDELRDRDFDSCICPDCYNLGHCRTYLCQQLNKLEEAVKIENMVELGGFNGNMLPMATCCGVYEKIRKS